MPTFTLGILTAKPGFSIKMTSIPWSSNAFPSIVPSACTICSFPIATPSVTGLRAKTIQKIPAISAKPDINHSPCSCFIVFFVKNLKSHTNDTYSIRIFFICQIFDDFFKDLI